MNRADRVARWFADRPVVTSLVLVTVVVAVVTWLNARQDDARADYARCVADWADATTTRSDELSTARRVVDAQNDVLWRTLETLVTRPDPNGRVVLQEALAAYRNASDAYAVVLHRYPVPESPRLACE